jgi:hypothetical protein
VKTYIDCIGNIYEFHAVLPSIEVMSVPLFHTMTQHPFKELGFEITLSSPHPQTVDHQRQSSFYQSLQKIAQAVCAEVSLLIVPFP